MATTNVPRSSLLLDGYLLHSQQNAREFADSLDLNPRSVQKWRKGGSIPKLRAAVAMHDVSDGFIDLRGWLDEVKDPRKPGRR